MGVNNIRKWKVFRKIAAISAIIQGATWLTMATICIIMYYAELPSGFDYTRTTLITKHSRYLDLISFAFYDTLLWSYHNHEDRSLRPQNFHVFAWFYAILSACWLGFAISESVALFSRKKLKYEAHILMLLGIIAVLTCILDAVMTSLAFKDYFTINVFDYGDAFLTASPAFTTTILTPASALLSEDELNLGSIMAFDDGSFTKSPYEEFEENIDIIFRYKIGRKLSYGILITICARGFIIWIFNCTSGVILLMISLKIFRAPPILKYDNKSIPRPKVDSPQFQRSQPTSFGSTFAEDRLSPPPVQQKRYSSSLHSRDRNAREQSWYEPRALSEKNRRNENMFS